MCVRLDGACEPLPPTTVLTAETVASLTAEQIEAMTDVKLLAVVQVVGDRVRPFNRTADLDRRTLATWAFLARRCCQGQS